MNALYVFLGGGTGSVFVDMRRSVMVMNLLSLLHEGAITKDDLDGFSDELRQSLLGA